MRNSIGELVLFGKEEDFGFMVSKREVGNMKDTSTSTTMQAIMNYRNYQRY